MLPTGRTVPNALCNVLWLPWHLILSSEIMYPILLHSSFVRTFYLPPVTCLLWSTTLPQHGVHTWYCRSNWHYVYDWLVRCGETPVIWEFFTRSHSHEHGSEKFTVPSTWRYVRLGACFVAAPTGLISVKFGLETIMDICRGNENVVTTRQKFRALF